jgi:Secretion system C-terminal sorting domain
MCYSFLLNFLFLLLMKNIFTLFLICMAFISQAQTININSGIMNDCYYNIVASKNGITSINSITRNTYTGTTASGPMRVIYTSNNGGQWEIQTDLPGWTTDFYSSYQSYPNPPHLSVGNWQNSSGGACLNLSNFSGTGTQLSLTVLPIELVTFDAQSTQEGKTNLTWKTASETQNKGFEIEASKDGVRFQKIGFVAGAGTTQQEQRYTFEHNIMERSEGAYYRLRQLDFDGRFEYSKTIVVQNKNTKQNTVIYPNPSQGVFNILTTKKEDKTLIFNNIGILVRSFDTAPNELDLSDLPSGIYWIAIGEEKVKIVKM